MTPLSPLRVKKWVKKWGGGVISEECSNWVEVDNPKLENLYANVKTHKENWPCRFIMSSRGTATERLAKWLEYQPGLPLTWKTWKSQGICNRISKVRENSGNFVV